MKILWTAVRISIVTLIVTGLLYPAAVTLLAKALFPGAASGSLVVDIKGNVVGSSLIGQAFRRPYYFHPRPSAAGMDGHDAASSGGSNLGPTSKALRERVSADIQRLRSENPDAPGPVPQDLVTASGSGLDPHISPAAARWQAPRVARARGVEVERVLTMLEGRVEGRDLGFLGAPRVNVLLLNLALDQQFGRPVP